MRRFAGGLKNVADTVKCLLTALEDQAYNPASGFGPRDWLWAWIWFVLWHCEEIGRDAWAAVFWLRTLLFRHWRIGFWVFRAGDGKGDLGPDMPKCLCDGILYRLVGLGASAFGLIGRIG